MHSNPVMRCYSGFIWINNARMCKRRALYGDRLESSSTNDDDIVVDGRLYNKRCLVFVVSYGQEQQQTSRAISKKPVYRVRCKISSSCLGVTAKNIGGQ